jgi:hypothetical protein
MHFKQWQIGTIKRARTTPADPGKQFERLRAVTLFPFVGAAARLEDQAIKTFVVLCHCSHDLSDEETPP